MPEPSGWVGHWTAGVTAFRARVRGRRGGALVSKTVVGLLGTIVLLAGVSMLALPGPGWATIVAGLAILSTEFRWAAALRHLVVNAIVSAGSWIRRQPWWLRWLCWLGVAALIVGGGYASLAVIGVPTWLWDPAQRLLQGLPLMGG